MNLNFVEIGTSNFDTLIQKASDKVYGMSIEPISEYLNQLPNPPNVIKLNCAVSFDDTESDIEIYYIPENIINDEQLPAWLKGCNSIGKYHLKHVEYNLEKFVKIEKVKQIPIAVILKTNNIESIEFLKIDTEGGDTFILKNLFKYLKNKNKTYYPKKITFESNRLSKKEDVDEVINLYISLGYKLVKRKLDTTLVLCGGGEHDK